MTTFRTLKPITGATPPALPAEGFLRIKQILGDRQATPPVPALIPVSTSAWWAGCKAGRYPAPIKLSPRVTVWRAADIRALLAAR
jgi:prophage regulatory protein